MARRGSIPAVAVAVVVAVASAAMGQAEPPDPGSDAGSDAGAAFAEAAQRLVEQARERERRAEERIERLREAQEAAGAALRGELARQRAAAEQRRQTLAARIDGLRGRLDALETPPDPEEPPDRSDAGVGMNLTSVAAHTTSWPFANVLRQIKWKDRAAMRRGEKPTVGGEPMGWPMYAGATGRTLYDQSHYPAGTYTAVWEGSGRISFTEWGDDVASESRIGPRMIQIEVKPGSGDGIRLDIVETDPENPVRNVRLWLPGVDVAEREARYAETGFGGFSTDFLERVAPFRVLRLMDWLRTNNSTIERWEDRPTLADRSWHDRDVPVEVLAALAADADTDIWVCMPHRASDGYVRRFARMIRERGPPEARVYVEYSNECWNWAFDQADWCLEKGKALGLGRGKEARDRYYARRAGEVFAIWRGVFAREEERLTCVLSSQASSPEVSERLMETDAAAEADALAVAPYFKAWNLEPGASAGDVLDAAEANLDRPEYAGRLAEHARLAAGRGLKLLAYEGGPALLPGKALKGVEFESGAERKAAESAMLATMIEASSRPRMHHLIARSLRVWKDAGGGLFMYFALADSWGRSGMWGSLQWLTQPVSDAPKYRAAVEAALTP